MKTLGSWWSTCNFSAWKADRILGASPMSSGLFERPCASVNKGEGSYKHAHIQVCLPTPVHTPTLTESSQKLLRHISQFLYFRIEPSTFLLVYFIKPQNNHQDAYWVFFLRKLSILCPYSWNPFQHNSWSWCHCWKVLVVLYFQVSINIVYFKKEKG